jgi:hypothetical protein
MENLQGKEDRYYFRDYTPEAYECPCYIKSITTVEPVKLGSKFNTKLSLCIDKNCIWHKGDLKKDDN